MNGPIASALPADEHGWRYEGAWQINAESSGSYGDAAVGTAFESYYMRQLEDGTYVSVTFAWWVEETKTYNQPEVIDAWCWMDRMVTVWHTDPDDAGGSETHAEYDYGDGSVFFYQTYDDAERDARRNGLQDERWKFAPWWDGSGA